MQSIFQYNNTSKQSVVTDYLPSVKKTWNTKTSKAIADSQPELTFFCKYYKYNALKIKCRINLI